ncbi:MAG: hypothetical protein R2873_23060 [Caldilineaceae bacterium]
MPLLRGQPSTASSGISTTPIPPSSAWRKRRNALHRQRRLHRDPAPDALAFTWKKLGTDCENLPEAHVLVQAFNLVAHRRRLCSSNEAIVHPDEVNKYIGATNASCITRCSWRCSGTASPHAIRLLRHSMSYRYAIPADCCLGQLHPRPR